MKRKSFFVMAPGRLLLTSMLAAIALGTFLLTLPIAQAEPVSLFDCIFTATSTTCVTGLLTIPLASFTTFGHAVILMLMHIGGLGLVTLMIFFLSFFVEFGLNTHLLAGHILDIEEHKISRTLIRFITVTAIVVELVGTLSVYATLPITVGSTSHRLFLSFFHAASSFCSVGLTLFEPEFAPVARQNIPLLAITVILMLAGSIGFVALREILYNGHAWFRGKMMHWSLQTKIIISTTIAITVVATALMWFLEHNACCAGQSWFDTAIQSIFHAFSFRSCGFATFNVSEAHLATLLTIMVISFIGSSPGSTGSGVKVTAFALALATVRAVVMGKSNVQLKKRRIPQEQVFKGFAVITLSLMWIGLISLALLMTEQGLSFLAILFETVSAFSNLGTTLDVTPDLSLFGKVLIMITMLIGRIGSLTIILAFMRRSSRMDFNYPEERVMIG